MANGTTVKDCEFKKECERAYGRDEDCGILSRGDVCVVRKVAILVHNRAIENATKEMEIRMDRFDHSYHVPPEVDDYLHVIQVIETLKMEVDWETP